jgi:hypothetical protein
VHAQASRPDEIIETLENFELRFAVSTGRHSFVLGSKIIYRADAGFGTALDSEGVELWFPIGSKSAILLVKDSRRYPPILDLQRDWMRKTNEWVCRDSLAVASSSERLLHSLLQR